MLTTKSNSPFTQFNAQYYQNLRNISWEKAEEYRLSVTKAKKNAHDLWKKSKEISEHEIRGIEQPEQTAPETKWTVDLADLAINMRSWRNEPQENQETVEWTQAPDPEVQNDQQPEPQNQWETNPVEEQQKSNTNILGDTGAEQATNETERIVRSDTTAPLEWSYWDIQTGVPVEEKVEENHDTTIPQSERQRNETVDTEQSIDYSTSEDSTSEPTVQDDESTLEIPEWPQGKIWPTWAIDEEETQPLSQ